MLNQLLMTQQYEVQLSKVQDKKKTLTSKLSPVQQTEPSS